MWINKYRYNFSELQYQPHLDIRRWYILKHSYVADDISPLKAEDYNDSIMTAINNRTAMYINSSHSTNSP